MTSGTNSARYPQLSWSVIGIKVTSTIKVRQLAWTELKNTCPNCDHEEILKADTLGMTAEIPVDVSFTLPDRLITRDDTGRATGSIDTANLLRDMVGE